MSASSPEGAEDAADPVGGGAAGDPERAGDPFDPGHVLLLGGTSEARTLAELLTGAGVPMVSSLAGRVARPRLPVGEVRTGGFGGVEGLVAYLRTHAVPALVDATHPFSEQMTAHAAAACATTGTPWLRLERPGWSEAPGPRSVDPGAWHWVGDHDEAARTAAALGQRPFLTVGRQELARFTGPLAAHPALVRVVDPPDVALPACWRLLTSRGPYQLEDERTLLTEHGTDVLVTKDSGGSYTWPKMQAAAELDVEVVMVRRTPAPDTVTTRHDPADALGWVRHTLSGG